MKSTIKKEDGLKRQLELVISARDVDDCFLRNYKKIQKKAKISGFRQGKAPLNTLKQVYKSEIYKNVTHELFDSFYPKILKEHQIQPVGSPMLMNLNLQESKDCTFLFEVEVHPKIEVKNYLNLKLKKPEVPIREELVNEVLKYLRQSHKEMTFSLGEGFFEDGNEFIIDFSPLFNFQEQNEPSRFLNSKGILDRPLTDPHGDKTSPFKEPSHWPPTGKSSHAKTQAPTQKTSLPNLSGAWDLSYLKNLEQMRTKIKEALTIVIAQKIKKQMEKNVLKELVRQNPVEVPESLIKNCIQVFQEDIQKSKMSKSEQEKILSDKDSQTQIKNMAKTHLQINYLLTQLIRDLKMNLSREDIHQFLQEDFPTVKPEYVEKELKKMKKWENFIFNATRRKTLSYLTKSAHTEKVESNIKIKPKEDLSTSS